MTTPIDFKVIGYYDQSNIGDEQYKSSFTQLFKQFLSQDIVYTIQFINCDQSTEHQFSDSDIIIVGGGDVLNDYFLETLIARFSGCPNKIIAVSVGLPFTPVLTDTSKLNIIDYICLRTRQDLDLFAQYFHPHRVLYLPDLSVMLHKPTYSEHTASEHTELNCVAHLQWVKRMGKQIVVLSLSRHIYHPEFQQEYKTILNGMVHFIKFLTNFNYHVVLLPFNTNCDNPRENDILIHREVADTLFKTVIGSSINVTMVENVASYYDYYQIYALANISVPMRYHACLFSIYNHVPILPIFCTRKIRNLLLDCDWTYGYEMLTNNQGIPYELDLNVLLNRFVGLTESLKSRDYLRSKLSDINKQLQKDFQGCVGELLDTLTLPYSKTIIQNMDSNYINNVDNKIQFIHKSIVEFAQSRGFSHYSQITDPHLQDIIVRIVSFNLTNGSINSPYNYGLKTKMFDANYNYVEEWKWILRHVNKSIRSTKLINNPYGLFNIGFVDQNDYSGAHRSGWQYVYDNIKYLHNDSAKLCLDLYVDRTFHWQASINRVLGLIPYKQPWMGFIHHTFDTTFSDYNCYTLLESPEFQASLSVCRGLFVLSNSLKQKLEAELQKAGRNNVCVFVLTHPTDLQVPRFNYKKFISNPDKKLIHVGGWLRNIYSFYRLDLPKMVVPRVFRICDKSGFNIRKVALRGKNMSNYYPESDFQSRLHRMLVTTKFTVQGISTQCTSQCISQCVSTQCISTQCISQCISTQCGSVGSNVISNSKITNNWYRHFYQDTINILKSVDYIDFLENKDYDQLLTENIVYINLAEPSAANTVIECIARNTPLVINKTPAVVELLGEKYPLYIECSSSNYYQTNTQVHQMLSDVTNIRQAYRYLKRLPKQDFNINTFVRQLVSVIRAQT